MSEIATPPSSPQSASSSSRSNKHLLVLLIIGCLILSQLRIISNFTTSTFKYDSNSAENEKKLRHIENEKRKFAAAKGLDVDASAGKKIPYLDDDEVDDEVDEKIDLRVINQHTKQSTIVTDDITAYCASCMWNNTKIKCDDRVDFMMKRYPDDHPTKEGTIQSVMKKGFCVDPNWAPKFMDEEIASVESNVASMFGNHSGIVNASNSSLSTHNHIVLPPQEDGLPQTQSSSLTPTHTNSSTSIDLVSLTTNKDFFILFNNSAITSWFTHIQNIRSITFIGPPRDHDLFQQNMQIHYPHLIDNMHGRGTIPIRWINETYWQTTYKNRYRCPYHTVCQQLMKLFVFDLRTELNVDIGDNVLIIDSDTVWSRNTTFVRDDGTVTYFEVINHDSGADCKGMDPVKFTEGITMGPPRGGMEKSLNRTTATPYKACRRAEYPNATGARHIVHHMLFQYDVMMHLHSTITKAWSLPNIWIAFVRCQRSHDFCRSRVAEYELYFSFVSTNYPERVHLERLEDGVSYMGSSAICSKEEMDCCREQGVLLKGCHDHRISLYEKRHHQRIDQGAMCCKPQKS